MPSPPPAVPIVPPLEQAQTQSTVGSILPLTRAIPTCLPQFEGTPDFLSLRKKWKQEALSRLGAARGGAAQKRVFRVV